MKAMREAQSGQGSTWRKRLGAMMSGKRTVRTLLTASRMKRVDTSKVVFDENAAFWQQGDEALYTDVAVRKRAAVRHDPEVCKYLHMWWQVALAAQEESSVQESLETTAEPSLSKELYIRMMKKIYMVMIEEYDDEDAEECAEEDWEKDARGGSVLHREDFGDAIFELADVWTRTCETEEYVEFLRELYGRVATADGHWKDDAQIAFDPKFDVEAVGSPECLTESPRRSLTPARAASSSARRKGGKGGRGDFGPSGLHWQLLRSPEEDSRWAERSELVHPGLGEALERKFAEGGSRTTSAEGEGGSRTTSAEGVERASFSGAEWQAFGVTGLRFLHVVHSGGKHFVPVAELETRELTRGGAGRPTEQAAVGLMGSRKEDAHGSGAGHGGEKEARTHVVTARKARYAPPSNAPYFAKKGSREQGAGSRELRLGASTATSTSLPAPTFRSPEDVASQESTSGTLGRPASACALGHHAMGGRSTAPRRSGSTVTFEMRSSSGSSGGRPATGGFSSAMNTSFAFPDHVATQRNPAAGLRGPAAAEVWAVPEQHAYVPQQHAYVPEQHAYVPEQHAYVPQQQHMCPSSVQPTPPPSGHAPVFTHQPASAHAPAAVPPPWDLAATRRDLSATVGAQQQPTTVELWQPRTAATCSHVQQQQQAHEVGAPLQAHQPLTLMPPRGRPPPLSLSIPARGRREDSSIRGVAKTVRASLSTPLRPMSPRLQALSPRSLLRSRRRPATAEATMYRVPSRPPPVQPPGQSAPAMRMPASAPASAPAMRPIPATPWWRAPAAPQPSWSS